MKAKNTLEKIFNNDVEYNENPIHNFHSYPCKFPSFIPRAIIENYSNPGDIVCDPFVGSGTTLLESILSGHSAIGVDINPLSCLLAEVKSTPLSRNTLKLIDKFVNKISKPGKRSNNTHRYPSIEHWFQKIAIDELSFIKGNINEVKDYRLKKLLHIIFSSIITRVSNQESDTRYAAIDKDISKGHVIKLFIQKAREAKEAFASISNINNKSVKTRVYNQDSRDMQSIRDNSVNLIITSPPYANTYDYYLYHKHRKYWLGMDVKYAQNNEIGSRRQFSSLKDDPKEWEEDILKCLKEIKRITKKGGKIFIVIGDSVINRRIIKMNKLMEKLAGDINLKLVDYVSSPLAQHSKMFNPRFSSDYEKEEHLLYFEK